MKNNNLVTIILIVLALAMVGGLFAVLRNDVDLDVGGSGGGSGSGGGNSAETTVVSEQEKDPECVCEYGAEVSVKKAATCSEAGIGVKTCKKCGGTIEVTINATGNHVYTKYLVSSDGKQHYADCDQCKGARKFEGHITVSSSVSASCTTNGKNISKCSVCDHKVESEIPATGHNVSSYVASTSNSAVHAGVCSSCGEKVEERHSYGSWITDTEATCTTLGSKHWECRICGNKEVSSILTTPHDFVVAGGCGSPTKCSVCSLEGPLAGHVWTDWAPDFVANCIRPGTEYRECERCHYVDSRDVGDVDPNNHYFGSDGDDCECMFCGKVEHKDPNWTSGYCDVCGRGTIVPL